MAACMYRCTLHAVLLLLLILFYSHRFDIAINWFSMTENSMLNFKLFHVEFREHHCRYIKI